MGLEVYFHLNRLLFIIIIFIYCFSIQGVLTQYHHDTHWNYYNSEYSNQNQNHHPTYYRTENNPPIETRTEYGIETIQKGSAYINPRQKNYVPVRVGPDKDQTQHYFVRVNTSTHYLPAISSGRSQLQQPQRTSIIRTAPISSNYNNNNNNNNNKTTNSRSHRHQRRHNHHHHRSSSECVKCPLEKVIIAQKGLDGVLIDPPKLMSCNNRIILNGIYQIETLFGTDFKFLLPHGTHSFHGKIRSKRNPNFEQSCILRYKVIVQQCGRYFPQDENLRVKCYPGYIWGSKCNFSCRTGYLSHNEPMVCGNSLIWEGDEPECLSEEPFNRLSISSSSSKSSCDFIEIPDNGKFSCQYPQNVNNNEHYENELVTPEGTICRVTCNRNYEIPNNLLPYSILRCENGQWNSTAKGLCQSKYRFLT